MGQGQIQSFDIALRQIRAKMEEVDTNRSAALSSYDFADTEREFPALLHPHGLAESTQKARATHPRARPRFALGAHSNACLFISRSHRGERESGELKKLTALRPGCSTDPTAQCAACRKLPRLGKSCACMMGTDHCTGDVCASESCDLFSIANVPTADVSHKRGKWRRQRAASAT